MNIHRWTSTLSSACLAALLATSAAFGAANVFDMPDLHVRHLRLLAQMNAAHRQRDYAAMETACREGVRIGTADPFWHYNLACALALQNRAQDALDALDRALASGFLDAEHAVRDADFRLLRGTGAFAARIAEMDRLRQSPHTLPGPAAALAPDASGTAMQTASNTFWSFETALFYTLADLPPTNPPSVFRGPEADAVNAWLREGTAAGAAGVLYVNRDNDATSFDITRFPGLTRLGYTQEVIERRLSLGLPNTVFVREKDGQPIPVVGHSSMGYMNSAYWRSLPRAIGDRPYQANIQTLFVFANQLFFFPAFDDYTFTAGDLFPANNPCFLAVAGPSGAELPFVEAAIAALAAMRPETRAKLTQRRTLVPTLSMLFRASQRTLTSPRDYLSGRAHPPVFMPQNLDAARLVQMAHALTTNDLPPQVFLNVRRETPLTPGIDFFDLAQSEHLFDTPFAIARVFRGTARTRTLELDAICERPDAKLHWVLLQGDPAKVVLAPCATNAARMTLTVAHHAPPFETPVGDGKTIRTRRVDIGVIAEAGATFSMPAIISFSFLANERRVYADDGRLELIDYTRPQSDYTDPLLSCRRNWKDVFTYTEQGRLAGWRRLRVLGEERFTAYGHRVATTDALGRAATAHIVRYMPRTVRNEETDESLPDLAQVDDNLTVPYRYASDDDRVGEPDRPALSRDVPPPAPAVSP
jgi:hypothetical protein